MTEFGRRLVRDVGFIWLTVVCLAGTWSISGAGQEYRGSDPEAIRVQLANPELLDQEGRTVRFREEVVGDRVAVIIPFYTTCTTSYPILTFILARLQTLLGAHLGQDVVLVSITVDPRTDTPARLKAFSVRQKARSGWFFLTGNRDDLGLVLYGVGALLAPNVDEHNHIPVAVIGSRTGQWRRFHGFPAPDRLLAEVERALSMKGLE